MAMEKLLAQKAKLEAVVAEAKKALIAANVELSEFLKTPELYSFETEKDAKYKMEDHFQDLARNACEGSHNFGLPVYEQKCFIAGIPYLAKMTVEYNRHDKTYYYVDESHFSLTKITEPTP